MRQLTFFRGFSLRQGQHTFSLQPNTWPHIHPEFQEAPFAKGSLSIRHRSLSARGTPRGPTTQHPRTCPATPPTHLLLTNRTDSISTARPKVPTAHHLYTGQPQAEHHHPRGFPHFPHTQQLPHFSKRKLATASTARLLTDSIPSAWAYNTREADHSC